MLLFQKQKSVLAEDEIEDVLTASALGCMKVDYRELSLNKETLRFVGDIDDTYEDLCNLISENFGLTRNGTYMANTGTNEKPAYNAEKYPACISKVILYQKIQGNMETYTYTSKTVPTVTHPVPQKADLVTVPTVSYTKVYDNSYKKPEIITPNGKKANTLSVYVEVIMPLKIAGREGYIKRDIYVILEDI